MLRASDCGPVCGQQVDQLVDLPGSVVDMGAGAESSLATGDDDAVLLAKLAADLGVIVPVGSEGDDAAGVGWAAVADDAVALAGQAGGEAVGQVEYMSGDAVDAEFEPQLERAAESEDSCDVVRAGVEASGVGAELELVLAEVFGVDHAHPAGGAGT